MTASTGMTGGRNKGYRPDSTFSGGEREPRVTDGMPLLQWAHQWIVTDGGKKAIYSGFVLPLKRNETLDKLLAAKQWRTIQKQQTEGLVSYWTLESLSGVEGGANLFFVALGLDTSDKMVETLERRGYGYGFHPTGGTSDRGRPNGIGKLNSIVYVAELVHAGFSEPCLLTAAKTTALSFNTVAIRNYQALDKLHELLQQNSDDPNNVDYPAFYLLAVEVVPGPEKKVGSGAESSVMVPPWSGLPKGGFTDDAEAKKWIGARFIRNKKYAHLLDLIELPDEADDSGLSLLDKSIDNSATFAKLFHKKGEDWWKSENGGDQAAAPTSQAPAKAQEADEDDTMWGDRPARGASAGPAATRAPAAPRVTAATDGQKARARAATVAKPDEDEDVLF